MKRSYLSLLLAMSSVAGFVSWVAAAPAPLAVDPQTILLLQAKDGGLIDAAGHFQPKLQGGALVDDKRFGQVVSFGEGDRNGITIADGGRMDFSKGFTLEMWVYFTGDDKRPNPGGALAAKRDTFKSEVSKDGKLNVTMEFPTQKIQTTSKEQLDYFPVGRPHFGGIYNLPQDQWVRLAITYNPARKVIRSWINGGIDRSCYLARAGEQPLRIDPDRPLELFHGMKNIRVGPTRLSGVARRIGDEPPMEVYFHQLPYEGKIALQFDHLDPAIAYPVQVAVQWEIPPGPNSVIQRITLDGPAQRVLKFTPPSWRNSLGFTLKVKAVSDHRQIYTRRLVVGNFQASRKSRFQITDKLLTIDGKKEFPLFLYHVPVEDFSLAARIGFNIVSPSGVTSSRMNNPEARERVRAAMEAAKAAGVHLSLPPKAHGESYPAMGLCYIADEPWVTLDKVVLAYNLAKSRDPDVPCIVVQNNQSRFSESAEGADILGCDPYPIPSVSLRAVSYTTENAVRAVAGVKPVWTVLDQYKAKRPSLQELRCMAHLAIISGANGLGIYSWSDPKWATKDHSEDLNALRQVIGELRKLNDVLIVPNSHRKAMFSPSNPALHAAVKEAGGNMYLLVANDSRHEQSAKLTLDGVEDARAVGLQGAPALTFQGGVCSITLKPLGVGVYELKSAH